MKDSIDSCNLSLRFYGPLLQKEFGTYMHGLAVMLRWDFLLHGTCLFKTLRILILFSNGFTSVGDFFVHLLYLSGWFLILFHLTLVKFLSSNLSANIFVFGDFHFTQMVNFFCLDA